MQLDMINIYEITDICKKKIKDTKGVIGSCKLQKDRPYNGWHKKKDKTKNKDEQNTTQKTKLNLSLNSY